MYINDSACVSLIKLLIKTQESKSTCACYSLPNQAKFVLLQPLSSDTHIYLWLSPRVYEESHFSISTLPPHWMQSEVITAHGTGCTDAQKSMKRSVVVLQEHHPGVFHCFDVCLFDLVGCSTELDGTQSRPYLRQCYVIVRICQFHKSWVPPRS